MKGKEKQKTNGLKGNYIYHVSFAEVLSPTYFGNFFTTLLASLRCLVLNERDKAQLHYFIESGCFRMINGKKNFGDKCKITWFPIS